MTSLPGTVKIWGGGGVEIATLLRLPPFLSPPEDGRTEEQGRERERNREGEMVWEFWEAPKVSLMVESVRQSC